jgi:hypothetical protein
LNLKGGILRVASVAEVAARLLLVVGDQCSWLRTQRASKLSCPWGAVGGCWIMLGETARRLPLAVRDCRCLLALVCLWASGFCAGRALGSPSESGAAFLLRVVGPGVPALCPVHLPVPLSAAALAVAAAASSTARRIRGSSHSAAAAAAAAAAVHRAAAAASQLSANLSSFWKFQGFKRFIELQM